LTQIVQILTINDEALSVSDPVPNQNCCKCLSITSIRQFTRNLPVGLTSVISAHENSALDNASLMEQAVTNMSIEMLYRAAGSR
jgi:hypothetical protein